MNSLRNKIIYTLIFTIALPMIALADDIDPHPADDDPMPAAPIDSAIGILIIAAFFLAVYIINKRKVAQES